MYYTEEQITELKKEYNKMLDDLIFNLQAKKVGNMLVAKTPTIAKLTIFTGATILTGVNTVLVKNFLQDLIDFNLFQTNPISPVLPLVLGIDFSALSVVWNELTDKFRKKDLQKRCEEKIEILDFWINGFKNLKKYSELNSYDFQNWIFYLNNLLEYKNKMGEFLSHYVFVKIFNMNYKDEDYSKDALSKRKKYLCLLNYERELMKGFTNIYQKSYDLYNQNINLSYRSSQL